MKYLRTRLENSSQQFFHGEWQEKQGYPEMTEVLFDALLEMLEAQTCNQHSHLLLCSNQDGLEYPGDSLGPGTEMR